MPKENAIVMYLEQARIHGEPIGVTHSEVLFTKPNGYTVQPHNRVVSKADNKTMGESFLNELIYVLGAEDGEERKLPYDREVLVYTSDEINSDNYRTYINAVNTGINCPVHNFKLSLTDVVSMGRKYRRHSKEVEASALELVVTESGNTALKLDAKGSKDYVAVHLSRKEARKFKAAFAASKGEPLSLSLHQYKIGGKKYYALFENHHDKYAPVDLEGVQEEKVKTICRTARSVAAALYFFSLLLYSVSFTVSVVLILAATGLIYINIPFLPDSAWDDACEFIKRPKEPSKNGNEETDVVPSAASIILQNIMDKYGTAEPEPEPVSVKPETPKKPEQKAESKTPEPTDVESIPDTPHQTKPEASNPAFKPKEVTLPTEPAKASSEPDLSVLDDVSLDTDEAADDTLALDVEIIDEDAEEVSLTADPEQDADAALVSIEQEAALASDDEDDAAALERELSALEATLPTPTTFDPSGIEEDEDDSESFDMDSWLAEDVPENASIV